MEAQQAQQKIFVGHVTFGEFTIMSSRIIDYYTY